MSTTPIPHHPQYRQIVAALEGGAAPAEVARRFDGLNRRQVERWWRGQRDKAGPTVTVTAGSDDELAAQLEEAKRDAAEARALGFEVRSVRIGSSRGGTDTETGWRRDNPDENAVSAPQSWSKHNKGKTLTLALPSGDAGQPFEIRQAAPIDVTVRMPRPPKRDKGECLTLVGFPDTQFPFVDHAALDVAEQLTAYVEQTEGVDVVWWAGDDLDFPEVGKHRTAPALLGTMQEGIQRCYEHKARVRAICPEARAVWTLGNHEQRLVNFLVDHAPALVGLRRAGSDPEPVLSVEFLCRTDELGIEVAGPYPEGEVWLTDSFRVKHGTFTGTHPEDKYLAEMEASTLHGHTHRAYVAFREVDRGPRGLRSYVCSSAGTLARLDGKLPSTKSGVAATGKPGQRHAETWQQGLHVVRYNPSGGELPDVQIVRIIDGVARYEGREFRARCDVDGQPLAA